MIAVIGTIDYTQGLEMLQDLEKIATIIKL